MLQFVHMSKLFGFFAVVDLSQLYFINISSHASLKYSSVQPLQQQIHRQRPNHQHVHPVLPVVQRQARVQHPADQIVVQNQEEDDDEEEEEDEVQPLFDWQPYRYDDPFSSDWLKDFERRKGKQLSQHSRFQKWKDTSASEIKAYIALQIGMGLCQKNEIEDYWGSFWLTRLCFSDA
ncbi:hypothetical protein AC249_AIPGENE10971 [Exaiptasia diaphana]|nr:hypothetical protein AC249_AIPGENE10971 [Exaiptasia diaphana]